MYNSNNARPVYQPNITNIDVIMVMGQSQNRHKRQKPKLISDKKSTANFSMQINSKLNLTHAYNYMQCHKLNFIGDNIHREHTNRQN